MAGMLKWNRLLLVLLVIMAVALSSCGGREQNTGPVNEDGSSKTENTKEVKVEENVPAGWRLTGIPSYEGGRYANGIYNSGPGLKNDVLAPTDEDSYMQIVGRTNADEFRNYLNKLAEYGYEKIYEGQTEDNLYAQFEGGGKLIYAYYIDKLQEARIIADKCSVSLRDFSYEVESNGTTTVYQFGLFHAGNTNTTMDCGMLYVIKLADNSLFIVDGGHPFQATDKATEAFMDFLREITGKKDGEKMRVTWFITHAHNDHLAITAKVLHRYHEEFNLERVMFNFPSFQTVKSGYTAFTISWTKQMIEKFHGNAIFLKPYTGMKFRLADMQVEVMYAQEDGVLFVNPTQQSISNFNDTSTVLKLTFDNNRSFILLGDADTYAEKLITNMYKNPDTWKGDIVQVTHHNFNYFTTVYSWIKPSIALVPNSKANATSSINLPKLKDVTRFTGDDNVYYAGSGTYGFRVVNGEWQLVHEVNKVIGGAYDKSPM